MAYERSWFFDPNVLFSPSSAAELTKYHLWRLKALLTGQTGATQGLWTVIGSSDGTTAALDGVDRWGATFDPAKIPSTQGGWIVLRSPGIVVGANTRYCYLTLSAHATAANAIIRFGPTAVTGGTTSAIPTAGADHASMVNGAAITNGSATPVRFHGGLNAAGDFYFLGFRTGSGTVQFLVNVASVVTPKANDLFPFHVYAVYGETFNTPTIGNQFCFGKSVPHPLNTALIVGGPCALVPWNGSNWNPYSFGSPDGIDGTVPDFPAIIVLNTSPPAVRGRIADIGLVAPSSSSSFPVAAGSVVLDGQGAVEFAVFGHVLFPFNAVPDVS